MRGPSPESLIRWPRSSSWLAYNFAFPSLLVEVLIGYQLMHADHVAQMSLALRQ